MSYLDDVYSRLTSDTPPQDQSSLPQPTAASGSNLDDVHRRLTTEPPQEPDVSTTPEGRLHITIHPKPKYDLGIGYQNQIQQGVPIVGPLMDKATAAIGAAIQPALQSNAPATFSDRYNQNLLDIRNQNTEFAAANPVGSTVANLVGGGLALGPLASNPIDFDYIGL